MGTDGLIRLTQLSGRTIAFVASLLVVYATGFALLDEGTARLGAISFSVIIILLMEPLAFKHPGVHPGVKILFWLYDLALMVGFALVVYWFWITKQELWDGVFDFEQFHIITGYMGLFVILELTRRTFGLPLALVTILFVIYGVFGQSLPWFFRHAGIDSAELIRTTWYSFDGVFGRPTGIVTGVVLIFIIFGSVLEATGAGAVLLRIAFAVTAGIRGGPAHAAIVASAFFGTMSGSAMANVVGTGVFTIPMIKKRGFTPAFAGGVEAAASCSGQVTPPIMAAAAFFVADFTGTPYLLLCVAALLPALFKYISIFAQVYAESIRLGIDVIPVEEREKLTKSDWIESLLFFVPIAALIGTLVMGWSPAMAGVVGLFAAIGIGFILSPKFRNNPLALLEPLIKGGYQSARIMVAVGAIGIILGIVNETGVALRFTALLSAASEDSLFLALVLAMVGCLILGMGLPTLPAYLIIVLVMGPAIVTMGKEQGISLLTVHLFVFYFGALSSITPPVALAAFAAAPIAQARPLETAVQSLRISLVSFIIPFVFAFNPSILIVETFDVLDFIWIIVRLTLAIWLIATAFGGHDTYGKLPHLFRWLRLVAALASLYPTVPTEVGGFVVGAALFLMGRYGPRMIERKA